MSKIRKLAAEYLNSRGIKTTEQGLADLARRDRGPKYGIVNGRAVYTEVDLDAWIAAQLARPITRRSRDCDQGEAA